MQWGGDCRWNVGGWLWTHHATRYDGTRSEEEVGCWHRRTIDGALVVTRLYRLAKKGVSWNRRLCWRSVVEWKMKAVEVKRSCKMGTSCWIIWGLVGVCRNECG